MKINYSNTLFGFVLLYLVYIVFVIFKKEVLLSDDLAKIYESTVINNIAFFDFIRQFLDTGTMAARPVSALATACLIYVSKYNYHFYFIGLIFFPISVLLFYYVLKKNLTEYLSVLICLFYSLILVGSSIQFSSIMLNSNLATIFWLASFYFIQNNPQNYRNLIISSLFFVLSTLSYEIFVPVILINLFFIKNNKSRFFYFLLVVLVIILYRRGLEELIFKNAYHRDSIDNIVSFERNFYIVIFTIKLFFRDVFMAIYKGFLNIYKINLFEIVLILIISSLVYLTILKSDGLRDRKKLKNLIFLSFTGIVCSILIFFFSNYIPTLFGFDNRNLGSIRLFYSIFVISLLAYVLYNLNKNLQAVLFTGLTIVLLISSISVKNAWVFASEFNNKLFKTLSLDLKDKEINCVVIDYNTYDFIKSSPDLILREPVFLEEWEAPYLSLRNNINPYKVKIYNGNRRKEHRCNLIYHYPARKITEEKE